MTEAKEAAPTRPGWHRAGSIVQGLVLGPLLTFAILNLIRMAAGATIFRYQGF